MLSKAKQVSSCKIADMYSQQASTVRVYIEVITNKMLMSYILLLFPKDRFTKQHWCEKKLIKS